MTEYVKKIEAFLEKYRNEYEGYRMSRYMKNNFIFLGISAPQRKELFKSFFNIFPIPSFDDAKILAKELFNLTEREYSYLAIELLSKYKKKWEPTDIVFFENLILTKSWWDTVDMLNSKIISVFFAKFPNLAPAMTDAWSQSDNVWLKRISITYQLPYKKNTDLEILERHILENADNDSFFIQKAIGWVLREYSKTDYKWVLDFLLRHSHKLKAISKRETIKWIADKGLID
jgi:3-methyladenine DNA glycosylase AlkD